MSDTKIPRTKGGVIHPRITRAIAKIGADISLARRVRKITAEDFAVRIGVSRTTLSRLEHGDPGISLNTLALALHAIGRLAALTQIADAVHDHVTMMRMKDAVPKTVTKPRIANPVRDSSADGNDTPVGPKKIDGKFEGF